MYKFPQTIFFSEIDEQMVLVDALAGTYFTLNETGAIVARGLSGGLNLDQIVASIEAEFDIDSESARQDCANLLSNLLASGLLEKRQT